MQRACIIAGIFAAPAASQWALLLVSPWPIPTNSPIEITLSFTRPLQSTSTILEHWIPQASGVSTFSSGAAADFTYNLTNLGKLATLTISAGLHRGLGSIRIAPGSTPFPLHYYSPPAFAPASNGGLVPTAVNSTGLSPVKLRLQDAAQTLPSASISVLSVCHATGATLPALITALPVLLGGVPALTVITPDVMVDMESVGADTVTTLSFLAPSVTATCGNQALYASYNGGSHYHSTGLVLVTVPRPPVRVVSLYPSKIGSSPWVFAHNEARMKLASRALTAVDTRVYYEESWRIPALPSGELVDLSFFERAVTADNASMVILAGTQYNDTLYSVVDKYPHVSFLMMSTKRHVLPYRNNVAYATGRMYEAIYYAGYMAASVSKTGYFGFIMNLFDPGSFVITNAFKLGIDACVEAGQAGFVPNPNAAIPSPRVFGRIIGAHSYDWSEENAALELVYPHKYGLFPNNPAVDILFPVTDNASPQLVCHGRSASGGAPCYSFGFNADERASLGDLVLSSVIFNILPVYLEFIGRAVSGKTFGQSTFDAGLGLGVDLAPMSPFVPLDVQAEVARRMADSKEGGDTLEEVFCAKPTRPLVDRNGVVLLYGNGTVASGLSPALMGERGEWCLQRQDVYSHRRNGQFIILQGVDNPGEVYTPPPQPSPEHYDLAADDPAVYAAAVFMGALIVFTSLAAMVMVGVYRRHDVIRFSSPVFLVIICAGGLLTGAGILFHVTTPNDKATTASCTLRLWLEGIGFCLLYGSLFAKTYRVHRLFNNHKLKRLKLNVWYVVRIIALLLAIEIGVLLTLVLLSQPQPETVVIFAWTSNPLGISHVECQSEVGAADTDTVLQVVHFALLLWGAYLAYSTRNVPLGFNESRYIGLSIYNIVVATVIGFAIAASNTNRPSPSLSYAVNLVHMAIPAAATLLLLFVPKALQLAATEYSGQQGQHLDGASSQTTSTLWLCCCSALVRCAKACVGDSNRSKVGVAGAGQRSYVSTASNDDTPVVSASTVGNSREAVQGTRSYLGGTGDGGSTLVVSAKNRTRSGGQGESVRATQNASSPISVSVDQSAKHGQNSVAVGPAGNDREGRGIDSGRPLVRLPSAGPTMSAGPGTVDASASSSSATAAEHTELVHGAYSAGQQPSRPSGTSLVSYQAGSEGTANPTSLGGSMEQHLGQGTAGTGPSVHEAQHSGAVASPYMPAHRAPLQGGDDAPRPSSGSDVGHERLIMQQLGEGGAITFDGGGADEQEEEEA